VAQAAVVSGTVRLTDSLDPDVRRHKDYSGVVVWLEPTGPLKANNPRAAGHARMEQHGKRFVPHVLAIQAGEAVEFPNLDPIFHSAFSNFSGQIFDLGLYAPGTTKTITFNRTGIVRVFCNIHPTMSAVIVVTRHPWFAVSKPSGAFSIENVPPGEFVLHVFHERASEQMLAKLQRTITVTPEGARLSQLTISETGYVEVPHKNKYGQEYPPVPPEEGGYTDGRR
jgi:plastocyanin